jgi:hypothetical protein
MKLKLVCHFSGFSMIFGEFCKISLFIEKRKTKKRKKKALMGLVQPTTKLIQLQGFYLS